MIGAPTEEEWFGVRMHTQDFQLYTTLQPKAGHTGCGMIVKVEDILESRQGLYNSKENKLYTVLTDFGNTFILTVEELETAYTITGIEKDPQSRFMRQQELLREAWGKYFK